MQIQYYILSIYFTDCIWVVDIDYILKIILLYFLFILGGCSKNHFPCHRKFFEWIEGHRRKLYEYMYHITFFLPLWSIVDIFQKITDSKSWNYLELFQFESLKLQIKYPCMEAYFSCCIGSVTGLTGRGSTSLTAVLSWHSQQNNIFPPLSIFRPDAVF